MNLSAMLFKSTPPPAFVIRSSLRSDRDEHETEDQLIIACIDCIHPLNAIVYDTSIVFHNVDGSTSSSVLEEIMK